MRCRFRIFAASLLLLVIFEQLSNARADPTLRELMMQDQEAKRQAELGISPTPESATDAPAAKEPATTPAAPKKSSKSGNAGKDEKKGKKDKKEKKDKKKAAAAVAAHQELQAQAQQQQAPVKQGGSGSATGGAALGTSALIGIGVGVGVACLVAVGSVIGVLVHLRRRKPKASQLEKQKTYGGTE